VLIVEDNADNARVLEQMVGRAGFQVRWAADGALALDLFRQWRPHFIWMDLRMPDMSGAEATQRIRAMEGGREVKIAAITASALASDREQLMTAGMDDFILKPYHGAEIFECMARHLLVRYRYIEAPAGTGTDRPGSVRSESLASLPVPLRHELAAAVESLNRDRILSVLDRVAELDGTLG
jgi:CheY-like chemotaxis protein